MLTFTHKSEKKRERDKIGGRTKKRKKDM